jgi:hypothetical protein
MMQLLQDVRVTKALTRPEVACLEACLLARVTCTGTWTFIKERSAEHGTDHD